jgi:putative ABC transport system substrate-binding protein
MSPGTLSRQLAAFHEGLKETGFVEAQNLAVDYRWAEGRYERMTEFVAEFVRSKVDVIVVCGSTLAAKAAENATTTIPIVFVVGFDPQETGLVSSLSRPGRNATGATMYVVAVNDKRVQLLRDLVPMARGDTVASLINPIGRVSVAELNKMSAALRDSDLQLRPFNANTDNDLEAAFAEASKVAKAIVVTADQFFFSRRRKLIVELAARYKLPAMYPYRDYVEVGGLISYGVRFTEPYRVAGNYTGRILKGANPADLPVQNPTVFDLTINLKALKELGLAIPRTLLAQANEIFDQ